VAGQSWSSRSGRRPGGRACGSRGQGRRPGRLQLGGIEERDPGEVEDHHVDIVLRERLDRLNQFERRAAGRHDRARDDRRRISALAARMPAAVGRRQENGCGGAPASGPGSCARNASISPRDGPAGRRLFRRPEVTLSGRESQLAGTSGVMSSPVIILADRAVSQIFSCPLAPVDSTHPDPQGLRKLVIFGQYRQISRSMTPSPIRASPNSMSAISSSGRCLSALPARRWAVVPRGRLRR
jgi:hypothetical protein